VFPKKVTPFLHSLGISVPITTFHFLFPVICLAWFPCFLISLAALLRNFVGKFPFLTCSLQMPVSNPCQDARYPNLIFFVVFFGLSTNMPRWHLTSGHKLFYSHTFGLFSFANY
jgi:hypothetical protein